MKILNVSFKRFSFSQLNKLYYRVKTFHYKTRQNLGGRTLLKNFLQNLGGGTAAPPAPPAPDPMFGRQHYEYLRSHFKKVRYLNLTTDVPTVPTVYSTVVICQNLTNTFQV